MFVLGRIWMFFNSFFLKEIQSPIAFFDMARQFLILTVFAFKEKNLITNENCKVADIKLSEQTTISSSFLHHDCNLSCNSVGDLTWC